MAKSGDDGSKDPLSQLAESTSERFRAKAAYKDMLDQRGNALMSVNETSGPRSREYLAVKSQLAEDKREFERIKTALRRPVSRIHVRPSLLVATGIVLAILEAPANKFLFDVALQSSGFTSYAASFGTTAFLLILAHFAGSALRQVWSEMRRRVLIWNVVIFLVGIGVAFGIVGVLTVARAAFASEAGSIGDLLTSVSGDLQNHGPLGALANALTDTSALVLACINLGGIVVTMLLAFFSHDPDRDFYHAERARLEGEKRLDVIHSRYLKARKKAIEDYAPDLIGHAANYNSSNGRVIELKTRLGRPLDDDDRFVLTDLDQMSEDADRDAFEEPPPAPPNPQPPNAPASAATGEGTVHAFRRTVSGDSA